MFGYFSNPTLDLPDKDPGFDVDCPVCGRRLSPPVVTLSLMVPNDSRSYFYRMHKACSDGITPEEETDIDSILIDAICHSRETN